MNIKDEIKNLIDGPELNKNFININYNLKIKNNEPDYYINDFISYNELTTKNLLEKLSHLDDNIFSPVNIANHYSSAKTQEQKQQDAESSDEKQAQATYSSHSAAIDEIDSYKYNENLNGLMALYIGTESTSQLRMFISTRIVELFAIRIAKLSKAQLEQLVNQDMNKVIESLCFGILPQHQAALHSLCTEAMKNSLKQTLNVQLALQRMDSEQGFASLPLTAGPLPKNPATSLLEKIFQAEEKGEVEFRENKAHDIEVIICGSEHHHLSYLLREADWTQFCVSKEDEISPEEQAAITDYTLKGYSEMNRLLRERKYIGTIPHLFKTVCLMVNGLNKMSRNQRDSSQQLVEQVKVIFQAIYHLPALHEFKDLKALTDFALQKKLMTLEQVNRYVENRIVGSLRSADVVPAGLNRIEGFMSSSRGHKEFNFRKFLVWTHSQLSIRQYSSFDHEAETIALPSQQYLFVDTPEFVMALEVNTPILQANVKYFYLHAMQYAYEQHLSRPFAEPELCGSDLQFGSIERPNHGLPHTLRSMACVDLILDFYQQFALDAEFKAFCANADARMRDKLKIILAFFVTGRESEVSWRDNLNAVNRYKKQSRLNFEKFARTQPNFTKKDVLQCGLLVEHGVNPQFLTDETLTALHTSEEDAFMHYVVSLAHNLDLVRCYEPDQMTSCVDVYSPFMKKGILSENSEQAKQAWIVLCEYVERMILNTGDRLVSRFSNGRYVWAHQSYVNKIFRKANTDVLTALAMIEKDRPLLQHERALVTGLVENSLAHFAIDISLEQSVALGKTLEKLLLQDSEAFKEFLAQSRDGFSHQTKIHLLMLNGLLSGEVLQLYFPFINDITRYRAVTDACVEMITPMVQAIMMDDVAESKEVAQRKLDPHFRLRFSLFCQKREILPVTMDDSAKLALLNQDYSALLKILKVDEHVKPFQKSGWDSEFKSSGDSDVSNMKSDGFTADKAALLNYYMNYGEKNNLLSQYNLLGSIKQDLLNLSDETLSSQFTK